MPRHSFDRVDLADDIERAVRSTLADDDRAGDIFQPGTKRVGSVEMGDAIVETLHARR